MRRPRVGRYAPFGNDRLLDTTNGTLYHSNGKEWVVSVELKVLSYEMIDDAKQNAAPVEEPQYEIVDDPDAK